MEGTRQATSRRDLLRSAGALGIASALPIAACAGTQGSAVPVQMPVEPSQSAATDGRVPTRPFGRSGIHVSSLALGGYFDALARQDVLSRALELGITYWETTLSLGGKGYGAYFRQHPAERDRVFLMAKTQGVPLVTLERDARLRQVDQDLETALRDVGREHIDFFVLGAIPDGSLLEDDIRGWVERAKAAGKIRCFGLSTHTNMEDCLIAASNLDWVDGVVTSYNYRLMQLPRMQEAIAACARRGIAVTAIKSQALDTNPAATLGEDTAAAQAALARLSKASSDVYQARLQAVWADPRICSICSMMTTPEVLEANARAARAAPAEGALAALGLASQTGRGVYCAGCANVCESTMAEPVPIADVMRQLMYAHSYGDRERARAEFGALGTRTHEAVARADYRAAEARCPQRLPIARLMRSARDLLGAAGDGD